MRDPLSAVAVYATGGRTALEQFGKKRGGADLRLTRQIINASGSSQYHCKACGAYGILERTERATEEKKGLIINVYQERSSMRGIERAFGVSRRTLSAWLKEQANGLPPLEETLQPVECKKIPMLDVDELRSFVFRSKDKVWVWIAMNRETREIVASACGDRTENICRILWDRVPSAYLERVSSRHSERATAPCG